MISYKILHWLFACENPFKLWGFFPTILWIIFASITLIYFFGQETPGLMRINGMVPFTWVLRCLPRITWFILAGLEIYHFAAVTTKVAH